MSLPDAERKLALVEKAIRRCVVPDGDLTDRQAISLILRILETGTDKEMPPLRIIKGE